MSSLPRTDECIIFELEAGLLIQDFGERLAPIVRDAVEGVRQVVVAYAAMEYERLVRAGLVM